MVAYGVTMRFPPADASMWGLSPSLQPSPAGRGTGEGIEHCTTGIREHLAQKSGSVNCILVAKRRASRGCRAYNAVARYLCSIPDLFGKACHVESTMYPRVILGRGR